MHASLPSAWLFDLDNTLFDRDLAFLLWAEAFARDQLRLSAGAELTSALSLLVELDDNGYGSKDVMFSRVRELYPVLTDAVPVLIDQFYESWLESVTLDPEAENLLAALLGAGVPFGVITNGSRYQMDKVRTLGLDRLTGCIYVSAAFGCREPDRRIFLAAASDLGASPEQAIFVGDHPSADIEGAAEAGMRTAWLRRGREWPVEIGVRPDYAVDSLHELLPLVAPPPVAR